MATSGTATFDLTRNEIITAALRKLGAVAQGESASAEQLTEGQMALNALVQDLQTEGLRFWTFEWQTFTLTAASEVTGTDSLNYRCTRSHTSANANRPITGANYKSFWKRVGSSGVAWANATSYSAIGEVLFDADTILVEKVFLRYNNQDQSPLRLITRDDYGNIVQKDDFSEPLSMWVDMQTRFRGYLYPQPDNTNYIINAFVYRRLEDFSAAGNNADFPARWLRFLIFALSSDLSPEYGLPLLERKQLFDMAEYLKKKAKGNDLEISDGQFVSSCF